MDVYVVPGRGQRPLVLPGQRGRCTRPPAAVAGPQRRRLLRRPGRRRQLRLVDACYGTFNKWRIEEGDSRTSDAATLSQFIEWAHASFPAEHYYLSIASLRPRHQRHRVCRHAERDAGEAGGTDAQDSQALAVATSNGLWQIDVLHFDACLMALPEVAHQVKDYAHYMIASENLTAALYPYDKYAQAVLDNPGITPRDLAVDIADAYFNSEYMLLNEYPRTISVLDLSQIGVVTGALNTLVGAMIDNMGAVKADIAAARGVRGAGL